MNDLDEAMARVRATYSPTEGDKLRVRAALGAAVAGSLLAGATAANGAIAGGANLASGLGAGSQMAATGLAATTKALVSGQLIATVLAGSALTAGGAYWLNTPTSVEAVAPHTSVVVAPQTVAVGAAHMAATPALAAQKSETAQRLEPGSVLPAPEAIEPEPKSAQVVERSPRPQRSQAAQLLAEPAKASTLVLEAKLIADASKALRAGNGSLAMLLLAEHAERYPNGALVQERQGLRALGLCATGQVAAAREAGRLYLQQSPSAPLAVHVKKGCE